MDRDKRKLVLVLCVFVLLNVTVVQCAITLAPENIAALVGSSVVFNCTVTIPSEDFVAWRYNPTGGSPGGVLIYQSRNGLDPAVSNLFEVVTNTNSGTYDLIVKSVTMDLGVEYWCGFMFDQTTASAGLVALQTIQCPKDVERVEFYEGSTVNLSCSVDFVGYAPPMLQWRDPDDNVIASQLHVQNNTRVTTFANVTLKAADDDRPFSCHLSFQSNLVVKVNTPANNLPSYTDNCTTTLFVIHPVTEVFIQPTPDTSGVITDPIYVGQSLNCTANGRPEPAYTWISPEGYTLESDMLEVTASMADLPQPITVMCTAKNTIDGMAYVATNNATFTALPVSPQEVQSAGVEAWVIAVAVVVPIVVIAIACIAGYLFYRHRKSNDKKPSSAGTTSATPFISPYPSSGGGGGTQPPPSNRYPPATATTNSAFVPVTRAVPLGNGTTTPATPGYGDISGGLNGSTNRLNYAPPPGTNVARPAPATNGVRPGNAGRSSSGSSTPSTTQINPPNVSMRPNPVSPVPRAAVNQSRPIYSPVNNANQRPPSVASSSSRATSNYVPSASGAGGVGASSRLNYSSSAHGSVV